MDITALSHVDPANDTVVLVLDLIGSDPFQHEFLKAVFKSELSTSAEEVDEVHGRPLGPNDLRIRLPFTTKGAFDVARRVVNGLPTLEQEEADKAAAEKAEADAKAAAALAAEAQAAEAKRAEEQKNADIKNLAAEIAEQLKPKS